MTELADQKCIACSGGMPKVDGEDIPKLLAQLDNWLVDNEHHLSKEYRFPDFKQAIAWVNKVGELAEEQGHHPNIYFTWGYVKIDLFTHKVDGLTNSDFVLAAKIDKLAAE